MNKANWNRAAALVKLAGKNMQRWWGRPRRHRGFSPADHHPERPYIIVC